MATELTVDPLSLPSLMIEQLANGNGIGTATGFVVERARRYYLVTNLHVVSGRDTESGELLSSTGAFPDTLRIWHHSLLARHKIGVWTAREEVLVDEGGAPRWFEHPRKSIKDMDHYDELDIDVVVLPLQEIGDIAFWPLDLSLAETDVHVAPGVPVSIIGYPFGRTGPGLFPIWKTGHIASDRDAYWARRFFLIDATTREGMSGSPVVHRAPGFYRRRDDAATVLGSPVTFLGVYSGRMRQDAEIGTVWRAELLDELLSLAAGEGAEKNP
jgi:hypothetical protein